MDEPLFWFGKFLISRTPVGKDIFLSSRMTFHSTVTQGMNAASYIKWPRLRASSGLVGRSRRPRPAPAEAAEVGA